MPDETSYMTEDPTGLLYCVGDGKVLALVVRRVDSAIHWITQLVLLLFIRRIAIYSVDSVIRLLNNRGLAPVVQKMDSVIYRINHYPLESAIGFAVTYPLDSDLSVG